MSKIIQVPILKNESGQWLNGVQQSLNIEVIVSGKARTMDFVGVFVLINDNTITEVNSSVSGASEITKATNPLNGLFTYIALPITSLFVNQAVVAVTNNNNLAAEVANKVDKIAGKTLTTNDFDNTYKAKLDAVPGTLVADLLNKVDKDGTKTLTTNDFDNAYKTKLDELSNYTGFVGVGTNLLNFQQLYPTGNNGEWGIISNTEGKAYFVIWDIEDEKWVNAGETVSVPGTNLTASANGDVVTINSDTGSSATIPLAGITAGLMSISDKSKLDSFTAIFTSTLKTAYDSVVNWVSTNGTALLAHLTNTNNPHNTTKAQVGLSNVDNTADNTKNVLSATKLTTARTINGVSFDGSANINLPSLQVLTSDPSEPTINQSWVLEVNTIGQMQYNSFFIPMVNNLKSYYLCLYNGTTISKTLLK